MTDVEIPRGLSTSEADLYRHLMTHVEFEGSMADNYELLAESHSEYVTFLSGLIAEDERRHHHLYELWAESLRGMAELRATGLPLPDAEPEPDLLLEAVQALLAFERQDAKELKQLARQITDMRDTTLWSLVIELMRADTAKHIKILTFIRDHAKATAKRAR
jgi:hypothetical protein